MANNINEQLLEIKELLRVINGNLAELNRSLSRERQI